MYCAYLDCRKRKRGTINALKFEYNLLENLFDLTLDLQKGTYQPSRSVCFIARSPKLREIFAADFRDRVVHHLVVRALEEEWERRFIHDSYASRKGKGTHGAIARLQRFMRKATLNQKQLAYFMQLDVRSFFMSIDKQILFSIFESQRTPDVLLYLLHVIILHDCTSDYYFRGDKGVLENVPPHKTLFKCPSGKGLPIGNLTSQFFANVYLNELDQFVKHRLRCQYYIRYVDDCILVSPDRNLLLRWQEQIEAFLLSRLALTLKPETIVRRVSEGADFLGYIVRPDYILVRRSVVNNLKYKLALCRSDFVTELKVNDNAFTKLSYNPETVADLRQVISSYLGHFKHADAHKLTLSLFEKHTWLEFFFAFQNGKMFDRLKPPRIFRSMRAQINFFRVRLKGHILFTHVGRYVELYDGDALRFQELCGISLRKQVRGFRIAAGFPRHRMKGFLRAILQSGENVAVIEQGRQGKYIKDRYVSQSYAIAK